MIPGTFRWVNCDSEFSHNHEVILPEFIHGGADSPPLIRFHHDEAVHLDLLYRDPLFCIPDLGWVICCGIKALWNNPFAFGWNKSDLCHIYEPGTMPMEPADNSIKTFTGVRTDPDLCITLVGLLLADFKHQELKITTHVKDGIKDILNDS